MNRLEDFDYHLPPELVAQYPAARRDASRLLVVRRATGEIQHAAFTDLGRWLDPRDLLVVNDTRVFPARLQGRKESGGRVELLLHHLPVAEEQEDLAPSARARATYRGRLKVGQGLRFGDFLTAKVLALVAPGVAEVRFDAAHGNVRDAVLRLGEVPLPPYIHRPPEGPDQERYQTVYAVQPGAVAAPTAGLHFTPEVLADLARQGIDTAAVTLHVGPGTFMPVRHPDYTRHRMHPEYFELSAATAARLNEVQSLGKRLVAVGTTSVRVLEHCAGPQGFRARTGWCDLFIYPGYQFRAVDRLLTNFHLPKSTLLLLVSAFAGRDLILRAYAEAVKEKYRFYSYGDCMLIM
jgi:S-adenosylmethionine:tRNA ribosyltransferase-isomerase